MKTLSLLLFLAIGILAVYGETVENDPIDDFDSDPEALDEDALEDSENDAVEENAEADPLNPISFYCKYCRTCSIYRRHCSRNRCHSWTKHTMNHSCRLCKYCNPRYYANLLKQHQRRIVRSVKRIFRRWG
eukprot:gene2998-1257_t